MKLCASSPGRPVTISGTHPHSPCSSQWLAKSVAGRLDEREDTMLKFIEQHGARMYELVSGCNSISM
jgi:hypothetical protein